MGPKVNDNRLEAMEQDLNLVHDILELMETNLTHLLQQVMQRMERLEMRSNSSNKGESVGELAEPLITERSAYKSPDRALVGPTVVQQPRAPPPEARTGSQLDLPTFNGGDVAEWMFLLEFYFWVTKTLDQDKISVVVMKLSGRALQ